MLGWGDDTSEFSSEGSGESSKCHSCVYGEKSSEEAEFGALDPSDPYSFYDENSDGEEEDDNNSVSAEEQSSLEQEDDVDEADILEEQDSKKNSKKREGVRLKVKDMRWASLEQQQEAVQALESFKIDELFDVPFRELQKLLLGEILKLGKVSGVRSKKKWKISIQSINDMSEYPVLMAVKKALDEHFGGRCSFFFFLGNTSLHYDSWQAGTPKNTDTGCRIVLTLLGEKETTFKLGQAEDAHSNVAPTSKTVSFERTMYSVAGKAYVVDPVAATAYHQGLGKSKVMTKDVTMTITFKSVEGACGIVRNIPQVPIYDRCKITILTLII